VFYRFRGKYVQQIPFAMIKKILTILLIAGFFGCTKKQSEVLDCPSQPCTLMFASISVQFQEKNGNAVSVKNFTAVNQRTNETLSSGGPGLNGTGYTVADDGMRSKLSTAGDDVIVTATHPTNGQTKTATFKISGGCNCHVERISGPQVITFD
jgi:hypothetical protein